MVGVPGRAELQTARQRIQQQFDTGLHILIIRVLQLLGIVPGAAHHLIEVMMAEKAAHLLVNGKMGGNQRGHIKNLDNVLRLITPERQVMAAGDGYKDEPLFFALSKVRRLCFFLRDLIKGGVIQCGDQVFQL